MILSYKQIKINVEFFSEFIPKNKSILFLHGFTGSAYDWQEFKQKISPGFNTIALDLIGHGKSSSPADIKFYKSDEIVKQLLFVTDYLKIEKAILCGYSMGGRAALRFATTHPGASGRTNGNRSIAPASCGWNQQRVCDPAGECVYHSARKSDQHLCYHAPM